jgi:hypothetical protein
VNIPQDDSLLERTYFFGDFIEESIDFVFFFG